MRSQPLHSSRSRLVLRLSVLTTAALLGACAVPPASTPGGSGFTYTTPITPEMATGYQEKPGWATQKFAVAAANPLATDAGYQVLKAGGSAIDAAIAVQMVLSLVEPQSSGIGGGAFLLFSDDKGQVTAYDGRETAPAGATEGMFLGADGKPVPFYEAVVGGQSVGVPGAVRMLELAHQKHGKLPWASLFQPAIQLAQDGFKVSPRLNALLKNEQHLKKDPLAATFFYDGAGQPWPVGHVLKNPDLAHVLRAIAAQGSKALHEGPIAEAIVKKVNSHTTRPGSMTLRDLAGYQAKTRDALCFDWRTSISPAGNAWRVCGFPPPSSGVIAIGQILGMLGHTNAQEQGLVPGLGGLTPSADWLHAYTEASRLAFADRAQYVADPDFVSPPAGSWHSLLAPAYVAERAKLINTAATAPSMKVAQPGNPGGVKASYAPMPDQIEHGTSHISIVDAAGNAVAMTTTIEDQFGSRQLVNTSSGFSKRAGGFLLNNQLTDFSFAPKDAQGQPIANRIQPGKRPRSSMSPTLVFDKATGTMVMNVGSPGGALIIHYVTKTLYGNLQWGLTPQMAIDLPNFGSLNGPTLLEEKRFAPETVNALRQRGADVREMDMTSGLQALTRYQVHGQMVWLGGADPRREGVVMGD